MKKSTITFIVLCFCILFSIVFMMKQNNGMVKKEEQKEQEGNKSLDERIGELSLEEKIGQMLIISNSSTSMNESFKSLLEQVKPGGIIFFKENFTNYEKTKTLIEEIEKTSKIPYLLATDQEGGRVQRLSKLEDKNITLIPQMKELGKRENKKLAYNVGKVIAEELQVFGINMNFAPVIDVLSNSNNQVIGDRSFGTSKEIVSELGISLAKGLMDHGVIPVYKHFPGHGNTEVDSHYDLPLISKTKEELLENDLIPFQNAIQNGAEVIMIGHLAVPNISNDIPASLSKVLISDLLKQEMNYNGLVITDALNMKAITNRYEPKEIYEMAINAGVDLLLMPKDPLEAMNKIKESIEKGTIKESQIDQSVKKILNLKLNKLSKEKLDPKFLGSDEHQQIINSIQEDNN